MYNWNKFLVLCQMHIAMVCIHLQIILYPNSKWINISIKPRFDEGWTYNACILISNVPTLHDSNTQRACIRPPNCTTGFSQTTCQTNWLQSAALASKTQFFRPIIMHCWYSVKGLEWLHSNSLLPVSLSDPLNIYLNSKHSNNQNFHFSETAPISLYIYL